MPEKDTQLNFEAIKLSAVNTLKKGLAIAGSVISMSGAILEQEAVLSPATAQADVVCTTSPGGDSTICVTEPDTPPPHPGGGNDQPPDNGGDHDHNGKHHQPPHGNNPKDGNLLPLPKHHTNRYWATMILNEVRQGHKGRITASKPALHSLYQTRQGRCTPVEMVPDACVELDKTLLETLYEASEVMRFRINHTVDANHVTCSDHYEGRAADLARYNGSQPHNRRLLHIFGRVLHELPGNPSAQLLGPGDEGHSGAQAHWHIGVSGPNNICE